MQTATRTKAEDAYVTAHVRARGLAERILDLLQDQPAPDDVAIHWGHVGSMLEVNRRLEAVAAFLAGTET